jgi:hypothetical protein
VWIHDTLRFWRTLLQSTKASQAMSMAQSEGLGVQLLWTSLTRKRHCSAYPIRKEVTCILLGGWAHACQ